MDIETLALAKKYTDEHGGGGGTTYTAGDGIKIQHNEISVKTKSNGGITVNSDGVSVDPNTVQTKLTAGNGINISSNTISAKLKSNQGLNADTNGVYLDKNSTLEIDTNNKLGVASSIVAQVQASIMHGEASGSVASFDDGGANMPMQSCVVAIEPVQSGSGDPSPSNVRPITGWTECNLSVDGKNLLPRIQGGTSEGVTCTVRDDGSLKFTMTNPPSASARFFSDYFLIKAGTYKSNGVPSGGLQNYGFYLENVSGSANVGSDLTITIKKDTVTRAIAQVYANGNANNIEIYPMLRKSTESATYEAYTGQTYNIEFPSEAGTVYGGTLDVVSGVLTVDRIKVNASLWTDLVVSSSTENVVVFSKGSLVDASTTDNYTISNRFSNNIPSGTAGRMVRSASVIYFTIDKSELSSYDYAGGVEWLSNHQTDFVYKMKTPQTYQLTPTEVKTLLGINNIFADTGDIINLYYYTQNARDIADAVISMLDNLDE